MKPYPLLILLCQLWLVSQAQTPCVQKHKGEVLLRSAKGKNTKGIVINIDGNNGIPSDQNGIFSYTLSKCPGQNVKLKVSNEDYGLVNHVEMGLYTLRRLADPNDFQFSVIVSPNNQLEADRIAYYSLIAGLALDKGLDILRGKIAELEKLVNNQQQKNDRLVDSLATLRTRYAQANQNQEKRRQEVEEIAKIFAQRTDIDSSYQQAFKLYQNGKLTEALHYLSDEKMQDAKQRFLQKRALAKRLDEEAQKEQEFYISKSLFKATIYQNLFDMKSAEHWYREAATTDTTNINNLFTLAYFLQNQNKPNEPEYWLKKIMALNPAEPILATTLSFLGAIYTFSDRPIEAEKVYQQSQLILERLAQKNPDQYEPSLAATLSYLGTFYAFNNRPTEAEKVYQQSQLIQERWAQKNPDQYEPSLAITLNSMGLLYAANNRPTEAEKAFQQARLILERLVQKNPDQHEPGLAHTLTSLGLLYTVNNRPTEAEKAYQQARLIWERLAQKNPDQHEHYLAGTLNSMGLLYTANNQPTEAEKVYQQARLIQERLVQKNPDQYEPSLAATLNSLGLLYTANNRPTEAKVAFIAAKNLYKKWTSRGEKFEKNLSQVLLQLVNLPDTPEVEKQNYVEEAAVILGKYPDADGYGNLAWCLLFCKKFGEAEKAAIKGLSLDNSKEWINTNLALAYLFQGQFDKAKAIYLRLKDKLYNNATYKTAFIKDLADLEAASITHPDVARAKELLK